MVKVKKKQPKTPERCTVAELWSLARQHKPEGWILDGCYWAGQRPGDRPVGLYVRKGRTQQVWLDTGKPAPMKDYRGL